MPNALAEYITGEVKRIYAVNDKVHFRIKGDDCITGSQYYYFKMNDTSANTVIDAKNWYSMLLASAMAGKPVSVKVNSCPTEGSVEISYLYQEY
ncbi:hypothetical protein [Kangiella geojedonensis]|nr:hypothetical protein [Kangiella geojedonensis]